MFDIDLESEDVEVLKKKLGDCEEPFQNPILDVRKCNPYVTFVANLKELLRDGYAVNLSKQLRKQLQETRDEKATGKARRFDGAKRKDAMHLAANARCLTLALVPTRDMTLPSIIPLFVADSLRLPTASTELSQAMLSASPGALSLQMQGTENDAFAHEMRGTWISSPVLTSSTILLTAADVPDMEPGKGTSEATIPLEAKEPKCR